MSPSSPSGADFSEKWLPSQGRHFSNVSSPLILPICSLDADMSQAQEDNRVATQRDPGSPDQGLEGSCAPIRCTGCGMQIKMESKLLLCQGSVRGQLALSQLEQRWSDLAKVIQPVHEKTGDTFTCAQVSRNTWNTQVYLLSTQVPL